MSIYLFIYLFMDIISNQIFSSSHLHGSRKRSPAVVQIPHSKPMPAPSYPKQHFTPHANTTMPMHASITRRMHMPSLKTHLRLMTSPQATLRRPPTPNAGAESRARPHSDLSRVPVQGEPWRCSAEQTDRTTSGFLACDLLSIVHAVDVIYMGIPT